VLSADRPAGTVPGNYVMIAVADTGVGMNEQVLARAFDPFFTTKGIGKGSGLGLSMVHGVAVQSGGVVTIESRVDEGTTVSVFLPRADAPGAQAYA
jgi:signal transduction histidine kinase